MDESARRETYEEIATQLAGVLDGCQDAVAAMSSAAALLKERFAGYFWVGFYLPDADGNLRVGPYQGPIACLKLPAGRGVCGAAFASGKTQIVDDVHAIEDHIACDARSRSEIVVPLARNNKVVAVLDVDSEEVGAFSDVDREGLQRIAGLLAPLL